MLCNPTSNYLIALAFYSIFPSEFVYCKDNWYSLINNSHVWDQADRNGYIVEKLLSSKFIRIIREFINYEKYKNEINKNNDLIDDDETAKIQNQTKDILQFETNFKHIEKTLNSHQNVILIQTKKFYSDPNFLKYFDHVNKLFSVRNGIIQILKSKAIFRQGEPQDYISLGKSSMIMYDSNLTFENTYVKIFMKWMKKCFVKYNYEKTTVNGKTILKKISKNTDLLDYFLVVCSSFLESGCKDKKLFFFYGPKGNNSKSELIKLFEQTFGNYLCKISQSIFQNGDSGNANPGEFRTKGTLLNIIDEVKEGTVFETDKIKKETGGDSRYKRTLFSEGEDVKQTSKIIVSTNAIPFVKDQDEPTIDRFCILPFYTKWDRYANEDPDVQKMERRYPLISNFSEISKKLPSALLFVLVQYYPRYADYGIYNPPQEVIDVTNEYIIKIDRYWSFVTQFIENGSESDYIKISEVYQNYFKEWYELYYYVKVPNITTFTSCMESKLSKLKNFQVSISSKDGFWKGFKIKKQESSGKHNKNFYNYHQQKREDDNEVSVGTVVN